MDAVADARRPVCVRGVREPARLRAVVLGDMRADGLEAAVRRAELGRVSETRRRSVEQRTCSESKRPFAVLLCKMLYTSFRSLLRLARVVGAGFTLGLAESVFSCCSSESLVVDSASSSTCRFRFRPCPTTGPAPADASPLPRRTSITVKASSCTSRSTVSCPWSHPLASVSRMTSNRLRSVSRKAGVGSGPGRRPASGGPEAMTRVRSSNEDMGVETFVDEKRDNKAEEATSLSLSSTDMVAESRRRVTSRGRNSLHVMIRLLDRMHNTPACPLSLTYIHAAGGDTIRQPPRLLLGGSVSCLHHNVAFPIFQHSACSEMIVLLLLLLFAAQN